MNDRARAIEVLKRARSLLQEQLTERIVQARDEILGEALGITYPAEIDSIYEQLGVRLSHIQSMLANLPPLEEPSVSAPTADTKPSPSAPRALIAPQPAARLLAIAVTQPVAWRSLAVFVRTGNLHGAASSLAALFHLDARSAEECACFFCECHGDQPEMLRKVFQLHNQIEREDGDLVIRLAWECFGIRGLESIGVRYLNKDAPQFQRRENL